MAELRREREIKTRSDEPCCRVGFEDGASWFITIPDLFICYAPTTVLIGASLVGIGLTRFMEGLGC